ncbi:hypothetical protein Tsubulata_026477 [Turnera subulata]|uniref:SBP-type domain-containing protein n=1 Tax=Turnera subulata TaxID=218843 RepID=A0A9Q0F2C0_9ROSI|nr:hypothetical protein Tsubulata_026477 [Turnera subulata]
MEARIRGKSRHFCGPGVSDVNAVGKKSMEWDLNDWKWDGDLFAATPLNPLPSEYCRSRQSIFPAAPNGLRLNEEEKGKRELVEKRRRRSLVLDDNDDEAGVPLNLKLGGQVVYPSTVDDDEDAKLGKKTKTVGTAQNRAVCQVEDCRADLTNAKDYHRRHKVCDLHSKASEALLGNALQRFCQQCSRFHVLQEFDEGKRSCRRRLAGHNKRRRKTHPENVVNGGTLNDDKGSSYLLISLLRILANLHTNSADQTKDQDLLSHLLRNLASLAGTTNGRSISGLLQRSEGLVHSEKSAGTLGKVTDVIANGNESARPSSSASKEEACTNSQDLARPLGECGTGPISDTIQKRILMNSAEGGAAQAPSVLLPAALFTSAGNSIQGKMNDEQVAPIERIRLNNIDLNNVYDESQEYVENQERPAALVNPGTESPFCPLWVQSGSRMRSPTQMSGNSDSTSSRSPSSSNGEAQSRTDRIVFKLFGKDPNDFPLALRKQILDWLSHSPTDIESYIRPGCIILTIYMRLKDSKWEEVCYDFGASMSRLLDMTNDSFWKTGWVYARVLNCVSFVYSGQVVLDARLPLKTHKTCRISSIKPVALSLCERTQFVVKGFNIVRPSTRLLCAVEGKYLVQETCNNLVDGPDTATEHDKLQCMSFTCSAPNFIGRGFIEVEDYGLSSSFFPFIVAEPELCSEICLLEDAIELGETCDDLNKNAERMEAKNQALDFLHEMGWLLHRSRLKCRLNQLEPTMELFSFKRVKWLIEFSMEQDWCAVVKKILSILFDRTVDSGDHKSIELALLDMCLLHRAVRRNCRPMVELLLKYVPGNQFSGPEMEPNELVDKSYSSYIFKPDAVGPAGWTPLHIAASRDGSENVLDALTDDPGLVGIEAWRKTRDGTGLTPNDYACLQGRYSYIHLIQRKINKRLERRHVVLDIHSSATDCNTKQKDGPVKLLKPSSFQTEKIETNAVMAASWHCKACEHKLVYGAARRSLLYRPAMLSMVTIAAVCVCVALLFKSSPEVLYAFRPFRWELLKYGSS